MNTRSHLGVPALLVLVFVSTSAAIKLGTVRVTILDSDSRSLPIANNDVPRDCDPTNYSAYCHSSKTEEVVNTMLVQIGNDPPVRVACTIETKWSRCIPLTRGDTFDAKREKHGLLVYYVDDTGRARSQLYTYVREDVRTPFAQLALEGQSQAPPKNQEPAPAAPGSTPEWVMCSFTSTPAGADVTLDGRYVGSTPSVLKLNPGQHDVVMSIAGYADWKRHLTASPGSQITVNAALKKAQ